MINYILLKLLPKIKSSTLIKELERRGYKTLFVKTYKDKNTNKNFKEKMFKYKFTN